MYDLSLQVLKDVLIVVVVVAVIYVIIVSVCDYCLDVVSVYTFWQYIFNHQSINCRLIFIVLCGVLHAVF